MKRPVLLLLCIVASAALSYTLTRQLAPETKEETQLAWLRREFRLTDQQTALINQLQAAYQPVCAEHCRLIREATTRAQPVPSEIAQLKQICHDATLQHLRDIAAVMPPTEGRRFLSLAEPKVSGHEHQGPLGLP